MKNKNRELADIKTRLVKFFDTRLRTEVWINPAYVTNVRREWWNELLCTAIEYIGGRKAFINEPVAAVVAKLEKK